jgi:glutaminyl-peptide cyclotransferase
MTSRWFPPRGAAKKQAWLALCVSLAVYETSLAANIAGRVRSHDKGIDVAAVTVNLQGAAPTSVQSDATGRFAFDDLATGDWSITPRKLGGSGDAVVMDDAVFAIQAAVGLQVPSAVQRLAADVSGDGTVSAYDAALIERRSMGLVERFPVAQSCQSDWAFVPEPASLSGQTVSPQVISSGTCTPASISFNPLSGQADQQNFQAVLFGNPTGDWRPPTAAQLGVQVLNVYPHDTRAFTQGLLLHEGKLYESTGLAGPSISSVREVEVTTGQVLRRVNLATPLFGEGLARVGSRLIQLTWQDQLAFVYDLATFETLDQFTYDTEGWGLCRDGSRLIMSDGSSTLYYRDPVTFELLGQVGVTLDGQPLASLNELECVGSLVYANVWLTDMIVAIHKEAGAVTAVIDASGLLTPAERASADVLNGIAYNPETDTFLITGKLWPKLFEVRWVPAAP